jgi:hypothetical protein
MAARLARPHLPRTGEVPPLSLPLTAGPMPTRPVPPPPPSRLATGGPEVPSPQELALSRAENRERLLVVEETAMRGQLLVPKERRDALQAQLAEACRAVARERDILDAARRDIERTTGRPLLPPPPPERLHAEARERNEKPSTKSSFTSTWRQLAGSPTSSAPTQRSAILQASWTRGAASPRRTLRNAGAALSPEDRNLEAPSQEVRGIAQRTRPCLPAES